MRPVISLTFMLTALVGLWAAYDFMPALGRFLLIGSGPALAHALYTLARRDPHKVLGVAGAGCVVVAAGLSANRFMPAIAYVPDAVIAGALTVLLPLGGIGLAWLWQRRSWTSVLLAALALGWALITFALTRERSAWLALGIGALVGPAVMGRLRQTNGGKGLSLMDWLMAAGVVLCVAVYSFAILSPSVQDWLSAGYGATLRAHLQLWRDALVLIQDYPFTGSGFAATAMVYSSYVYLMHVPYQQHVHNLFLQIAVEQGLPGLIAFMALVVSVSLLFVVSWHPGSRLEQSYRASALAALVALLVHGLLDSELYASSLAPLMFLPFGFVSATARLASNPVGALYPRQQPSRNTRLRAARYGLIGAAGIVLAAWLALTPRVQAAFHANLGAVAQTQAELSVYAWPEWRFQDDVRRTAPSALEPALRHYQSALALDPGNGTAHRRLGQIALSLGDYPAALDHLEQAFAHGPQQRVNAQLLGEAYAVTGEIENATRVWDSTTLSEDSLYLRLYWYTQIGASDQAAWLSEAITQRDCRCGPGYAKNLRN